MYSSEINYLVSNARSIRVSQNDKTIAFFLHALLCAATLILKKDWIEQLDFPGHQNSYWSNNRQLDPSLFFEISV